MKERMEDLGRGHKGAERADRVVARFKRSQVLRWVQCALIKTREGTCKCYTSRVRVGGLDTPNNWWACVEGLEACEPEL